jgi:hypothetical protein
MEAVVQRELTGGVCTRFVSNSANMQAEAAEPKPFVVNVNEPEPKAPEFQIHVVDLSMRHMTTGSHAGQSNKRCKACFGKLRLKMNPISAMNP